MVDVKYSRNWTQDYAVSSVDAYSLVAIELVHIISPQVYLRRHVPSVLLSLDSKATLNMRSLVKL
jgi:hypothetical protein